MKKIIGWIMLSLVGVTLFAILPYQYGVKGIWMDAGICAAVLYLYVAIDLIVG